VIQQVAAGETKMISVLKSIWIWVAMVSLIVLWLPLIGLIWLFDRDPVRFRTGRWFRRLGVSMVKCNPAWRVHVSGVENFERGRAYVVVSNHQSLADIPLVCLLPWEMKWIAKAELFRVPFVGWMMRLAGDIPLDRSQKSGAPALLRAKKYLLQKCPVMIFPEGTRSPDGNVKDFTDGAFLLAIKAGAPVLPVAVEGSYAALRKNSWKFGEPQDVYLTVLEPVDTGGLTSKDVESLRERTQRLIEDEVLRCRAATGKSPSDSAV
jgi:1-acyl-sn-glycerol-3-phosphate acyltransferase